MVNTASTMLKLGTPAPDFSLTDTVSGKQVSLSDFSGKPLAIMFISAHCPFVIHVQDELARLGRDYADTDLQFVAVCANYVVSHPADAPDKLAEQAQTCGFNFPYLYDETQEVAKAYTAACTPDFFLFDADHKLVYRGQIDDSRPKTDIPVDARDFRAAADAVLSGKAPAEDQKPSMGCNIKWIPGNEPDYFG
ncbi:thioredoxin family protein [Kiritimatiellaeota bacterium B1221]|nr:thioredoxin family protein [Kiritimatiellaeota bacterium B1221]